MPDLYADVDAVRVRYLAALRAVGQVDEAMAAAAGEATPQAIAAQLMLAAELEALEIAALRLRDTAIALRPAPAGVAVN